MRRPLRCRFGLHRWQLLRAEGGDGFYEQCRGCGKYRDVDGRPKLILPS